MATQEKLRFVDKILRKADELEKNLPQIYMRALLRDFFVKNDTLWGTLRTQIIDRYPQHRELLARSDLAFRVVFRPVDNNATLPGFNDKSINTRTLSLWYGMDYRPVQGEYIGLTSEKPWAFYMLPDARYANPKEYSTLIYAYDNAGNLLLRPEQTTTDPLPEDNYLTNFLRMIIHVSWIDSEEEIDPLVHDTSIDDLNVLLNRYGISLD